MGVLYLARRSGNSGFARPVAIKVIHDHLAQNKRFVRMFIDEAKLSAFIDDPHVVRVEEFGQDQGRYFLVMEYVDGASLAQAIGVLRKRGRIPVELAVAIALQMTGGLHGAHEASDEKGQPLGIVHRDVSPHNVLVSWNGYVRIIDFGIAKAKQVGGQTKTGSLRGKLAYMPPEQARSARTVDRRADLYGVGLVLWEMLTFRRVFDADSDIAILNQIRDPKIDPPSTYAPNVPKALDDIIMRTLANEPNERPATGALLQRALAEAVPQALLVLPGDLAALMKKVRTAADSVAGGDDDAALYGDEVKRTGATFAGTLQESVAQANVLDTRASTPDLVDDDATEALMSPVVAPPPSSVAAPPTTRHLPVPTPPPGLVKVTMRQGFVAEDEATLRRDAPARPSATPMLRPSDGVRALAPSSTDLLGQRHTRTSSVGLLPSSPLSSSPHPIMHAVGASSSNLIVPLPGNSSTNLAPSIPNPHASTPSLLYAPGVAADYPAPNLAQRLNALPHKQKMVLAVAVPIVSSIIIAAAVIASGPSDARSPAIRLIPHDAAPSALPPSPSLVAPVIIAPPAAEPRSRSSAR